MVWNFSVQSGLLGLKLLDTLKWCEMVWISYANNVCLFSSMASNSLNLPSSRVTCAKRGSCGVGQISAFFVHLEKWLKCIPWLPWCMISFHIFSYYIYNIAYIYISYSIYIYYDIYNIIYPPGWTFAQSLIGGLVTLWFVQDIFQIVLGFA